MRAMAAVGMLVAAQLAACGSSDESSSTGLPPADGGPGGAGGAGGTGTAGSAGSAGTLITSEWSVYASGETGTPELELEVAASSQEAGGVFATPVASDALGNVYLSYMDPAATVTVVRKDPDGQLTTAVIEANSMVDPDHHNSSIGIDKYGYLHVVWGMHNSPWRYKVSSAPRDISSWDDIGPLAEGGASNSRGIPGIDVTYASFFKDRDGDLFVAFRHRVNTGGWDAGDESGGLARYAADADASQGRWTMLGGTSHPHASEPDNQPWGGKTLLWTGLDGVIGDGAYQSYMISHAASHDGRIHIAFAFNENNVQSWEVNHFGYAVSSDKGETWAGSDGQSFASLPMTDTSYDEVVSDPNNLWYQEPFVHVGGDGLPCVSAVNDTVSAAQWWHRSGSTWSQSDIGQGGFPGLVFADGYGTVYTFGWGSLLSTTDSGSTWNALAVNADAGDALPDYDYLNSTANVRFMDFSDGANKRVYTMRFPGHVWSTPIGSCPTALLFDGQAVGRNVGSIGALSWDEDWRCEGGALYVYSAAGKPSTRWTTPGVAAIF
jgi:hypothetical protein